jgi:hypothetical protein
MAREESSREDLDGGAQCLHDGVDGHGAMGGSFADIFPLGPPSTSRVARTRPSSLSRTIAKLRYQDRGSSDARFWSSLPDDRCQRGHQERRARANGEDLEEYQSWYWRTQGWTMNERKFEKTVKTWPSQPAFM